MYLYIASIILHNYILYNPESVSDALQFQLKQIEKHLAVQNLHMHSLHVHFNFIACI